MNLLKKNLISFTSISLNGSLSRTILMPSRASIWLTTIRYEDPIVNDSIKLSHIYFEITPPFTMPKISLFDRISDIK